MTSLVLFVASKDKKPKKLTKILKIEQVKIHIFWETSWTFGINVIYDNIKDTIKAFNNF